jgi:hypothetical protein
MAIELITFPRELPSALKPVGMTFVLDPMAEITPLRSGRTVSVDIGPTLWKASWESQPLDDEQAGLLQSWYDTLLSYNSFLAYHRLREYPLAYKETGWPSEWSPAFDGNALLQDVNDANMVELTLSALPVGFVLSVGDFLGFGLTGSRYALHRVAQAGVADGSGLMTIEVRPEIQSGYPTGSPGSREVALYRAPAEMIIDPGSWNESLSGDGDLTTISFSATQTL